MNYFSKLNWIMVAVCSRTFAQKMALIKWMAEARLSFEERKFFPSLKCVYIFLGTLYIYRKGVDCRIGLVIPDTPASATLVLQSCEKQVN